MIAESPAPGVDPATAENRRALARLLIEGAIRRYDEANREWTAVNDSFPKFSEPRTARGPEEREEWDRWGLVLHQAQEAFNHAEVSLAERIETLFDMLAPEGSRASDDEGKYFVPRAVRCGGSVYVLATTSYEYEPKTNVIAVYRESMVIDLEGQGVSPDPP